MAKQPSALLWNKEGMAYLLLQRNPEATKCFEQAIKLDKHAPEGYNNRGYMEYSERRTTARRSSTTRKPCRCGPTTPCSTTTWASRTSASTTTQRPRRNTGPPISSTLTSSTRVSKTGIMAQSTSPEDRAAFSFMVAKMYAQAGDVDHSLEYLRKAMEEGYKDINKVYTDSEFASLREDKRFTELMAQKPQAIQ